MVLPMTPDDEGTMTAQESRTRSRAARLPAMRNRLLTHWAEATADDLAAGLAWYGRAEQAAQSLADDTSLSPRSAAGIIAALSPRNRWSVNVAQAAQVIIARENGEDCPRVSTTHNRSLAWKIAHGADPADVLGGPKVRAFFANITGDHDAVTVDTWAYRAATGDFRPHPTKNGPYMFAEIPAPQGAEYDLVARAFRECAKIVGVTSREFQAAVWVHVRGAAW